MLKRITRAVPPLPPPAPSPLDQIAQVLRVPLLPLQIFWQNLVALRPWWPVVIPLLAWNFWRTYQREQADVLAQRTKAQDKPSTAATIIRRLRGLRG
jgi:hypothetical protein